MNDTTFQKLTELLSYGCPFCGARLDLHIEPVTFVCQNKDCPSRGLEIPPQIITKLGTPKAALVLRKRHFELGSTLERLSSSIQQLECQVRTIKAQELEDLDKEVRECKKCYLRTKQLCLWDEGHKKVVTKDNPIFETCPTDGKILPIFSIGSRRRAQAYLFVEWALAKRELSKARDKLTAARTRLRTLRTKQKLVEAELETIHQDKAFQALDRKVQKTVDKAFGDA